MKTNIFTEYSVKYRNVGPPGPTFTEYLVKYRTSHRHMPTFIEHSVKYSGIYISSRICWYPWEANIYQALGKAFHIMCTGRGFRMDILHIKDLMLPFCAGTAL